MVIRLDSIKKESEEVFYTKKDLFSVSQEDIDFLIDLAKETERKRVRLCCHSKQEDVVHEMIIVHPKNAYVRPHKHLNKAESMTVLRGEVDYIYFDEKGAVIEIINMAGTTSKKPFYQTIRTEIFHTLVIKSEWLVFLEVTQGPFKREDTVFAKWSPEYLNKDETQRFIESLYGK